MGFIRLFCLVFGVLFVVSCTKIVHPAAVGTGTTPVMGNLDTPNVLVVFSDFQCPFCKRASFELEMFSAKHPDKATIYFKHFPLRRHPMAHLAALAAEAAHRQGKFWEMHDMIFAHARELNPDSFDAFAKKIGLDVARFQSDMNHPDVAKKVADDRAEGEALGLWGTPFFVLNGQPYNKQFTELLEELLDAPSKSE